MILVGILHREEVQQFMDRFYESENCRTTGVSVVPTDDHKMFTITLSCIETFADLLKASFKDGLMKDWNKKFKEQ
ncbi:MAG: hypothetical protein NTZ97_02630 [Candidatus Moranbacteria bacterium]|nr:hypothetical protein [Candidatus Moranbacteria bacterium]